MTARLAEREHESLQRWRDQRERKDPCQYGMEKTVQISFISPGKQARDDLRSIQ
jgi:hypothetical protein